MSRYYRNNKKSYAEDRKQSLIIKKIPNLYKDNHIIYTKSNREMRRIKKPKEREKYNLYSDYSDHVFSKWNNFTYDTYDPDIAKSKKKKEKKNINKTPQKNKGNKNYRYKSKTRKKGTNSKNKSNVKELEVILIEENPAKEKFGFSKNYPSQSKIQSNRQELLRKKRNKSNIRIKQEKVIEDDEEEYRDKIKKISEDPKKSKSLRIKKEKEQNDKEIRIKKEKNNGSKSKKVEANSKSIKPNETKVKEEVKIETNNESSNIIRIILSDYDEDNEESMKAKNKIEKVENINKIKTEKNKYENNKKPKNKSNNKSHKRKTKSENIYNTPKFKYKKNNENIDNLIINKKDLLLSNKHLRNKSNSNLNKQKNNSSLLNSNGGYITPSLNTNNASDDLISNYIYLIKEIDENQNTIIINKILKSENDENSLYNIKNEDNVYNYNNKIKKETRQNCFGETNDIEILIKTEKNESEEDINNILGHKRKRNNQQRQNKNKKILEKKEKKNQKQNKRKSVPAIKKEIIENVEKKIEREIMCSFRYPKTMKIKDNRNKKLNKNKKEKKDIIKSQIEEEITQSKNEFIYNIAVRNNKRGTKSNNSMKKKLKQQKEEDYEDLNDSLTLMSVKSLSDGKKGNKNSSFYIKKKSKNYINNNLKKSSQIKNEDNEYLQSSKNRIFKKIDEEIDYYNNNSSINNYYYYASNPNYSNINNSILNNISFKSIEYGSSLELDNNFSYSFPIEFDEKIQVIEDPSYFYKNSRYIKYNPIDKYIKSVTPRKKKLPSARIIKPPKINFSKKGNMGIDSDNDFTDFESYNDETNEFFPILYIPRIKPFKEEHSKLIKERLAKEGIPIRQSYNDKIKRDEQSLYAGSFIVYDEENNIKVNVPCYRESERMKEFMRKKNLEIIEFQEDNDVDTDEEQLELEVERNNEALLNFIKKVEEDKDYVKKNLVRKVK